MTLEDAEEKITKAFGGYMAPKERQAMEIGWELSRAEALKEAAEVARTFEVSLAAPDRDGSVPRGLVRANFEIAEAIEAKMK